MAADPLNDDPLSGDGGLQPERTVLAWVRTALAFTIVAMLALRQAPAGADRIATGAIAGPAALAVAFIATVRSRRLRTISGPTAAPVLVAMLCTACVVLGVLSLTLVW